MQKKNKNLALFFILIPVIIFFVLFFLNTTFYKSAPVKIYEVGLESFSKIQNQNGESIQNLSKADSDVYWIGTEKDLNYSFLGLKFAIDPMLKSKEIIDARIFFKNNAGIRQDSRIEIMITAEKSKFPDDFDDTSMLSEREKTQAHTFYSKDLWAEENVFSVDVTEIVRELQINRTLGLEIVFLAEGKGDYSERFIFVPDFSNADANPMLKITYR